MEEDFSKLHAGAFSQCTDELPVLDGDFTKFEATLFHLMLYFSKVSKQTSFVSSVFFVWRIVQRFAAVNMFYLTVTLATNETSFLQRLYLFFLQFYIPEDLSIPSFMYAAVIQIITAICILLFFVAMLKVYWKRTISNAAAIMYYITTIEVAMVLLFPNCILSGRAISFILNSESSGQHLFSFVQIILTLLLFFVLKNTLMYKCSLFQKVSESARYFTIVIPYFHLAFLVLVGWSVGDFLPSKEALITITLVTVFVTVIYTISTYGLICLDDFCNYLECGYTGTLMYIVCTIIAYFCGCERYITIFLYASLIIGVFIAHMSRIIIKKLDDKKKAILESAHSIEDVEINSVSTFMRYFKVAMEIHSKFIYDGSFIEYGLTKFKGSTIRYGLLRYMTFLPLNLPHIDELEDCVLTHKSPDMTDHFRIFEYTTIKNWRVDELDISIADKLQKTTRAVRSYTKISSAFTYLFSMEDRSSSFIFGSALSEIEATLENHIEYWLLLHPTRIPVLKIAAEFYETSAMNKTYARELTQTIHSLKLYEEDIPNFREMRYMNDCPIVFEGRRTEEDRSVMTTTASEDTTSDSLGHEKVLTGDLFSSENHAWKTFCIIVLLVFGASLIVFVCLVFSQNQYSANDYESLVKMINIYSRHTAILAQLMISTLAFDLPRNSISEKQQQDISLFIDEYKNQFNELYNGSILLFLQSENLNNSFYPLYNTGQIVAATITGKVAKYSYRGLTSKIQSFAREVYPESGNITHGSEYDLLANYFINVSDWYEQIYHSLTASTNYHLTQSDDHSRFLGIVGMVFISVCCLIMLIVPFFLHEKVKKLRNSVGETKSTQDSRLITISLAQEYYSERSYIFYIILSIIVIFLLVIATFYISICELNSCAASIEEEIKNSIDHIYQMGVIGSALSSLLISCLNTTANMTRINNNVKKIGTKLYSGIFPFQYESPDHTFNIARLIMEQLCNNTVCYKSSANSVAMEEFISNLIPAFKNEVFTRGENVNEMWSKRILRLMEIFLIFLIICIALFVLLISLVSRYIQSVFFSEFIIKMLPFVKTRTGEKIVDTLSTTSEENKIILDLTGVPAAIIDENDLIIYVNHMWMSLFNGSQNTFIGNKYTKYSRNDPDGKIYEREGCLRIYMINRTPKIEELRKKIEETQREFNNINESTQPTKVLTEEQLSKDVISLTLSLIPFDAQSDDIDTVRQYITEFINKLTERVKMYTGCKIFLWSCYEISVIFGLEDDNLKLSAICALELASNVIRYVVENEDKYAFFVSSTIMSGKVGGSFDGVAARMNRSFNAISLSSRVAELLQEFITLYEEKLDNGVSLVAFNYTNENDESYDEEPNYYSENEIQNTEESNEYESMSSVSDHKGEIIENENETDSTDSEI